MAVSNSSRANNWARIAGIHFPRIRGDTELARAHRKMEEPDVVETDRPEIDYASKLGVNGLSFEERITALDGIIDSL